MLTKEDIDIMYAEKPAGEFVKGELAYIRGLQHVCTGAFGSAGQFVGFDYAGVRTVFDSFADVTFIK